MSGRSVGRKSSFFRSRAGGGLGGTRLSPRQKGISENVGCVGDIEKAVLLLRMVQEKRVEIPNGAGREGLNYKKKGFFLRATWGNTRL